MVGTELVKILSDEFLVYQTSKQNHQKIDRYQSFDLSSEDYSMLIKWVYPDIIIHCAANTNVDDCERNRLKCESINFDSLTKLTKIYPKSRFVFISSDAVFSKNNPRDENSKSDPVNFYGRLKNSAENFLKRNILDFCIIRSTPVGFPGINKKQTYVSWIVDNAKRNKVINLFYDCIFTPVTANFLAKEIKFIITKDIKGIVHISSTDQISKYDFGVLLCNNLNFNVNKIKKKKITEHIFVANRNSNQAIISNYYTKKFNRILPSVTMTIKDLSSTYKEMGT